MKGIERVEKRRSLIHSYEWTEESMKVNSK